MKIRKLISSFIGIFKPVRRIRKGIGAGLKINIRHASGNYITGTNEFPVQEILAHYLKSGDVFYDIGANIGFFSLLAARLVGPSGRVYAFEPVPENAFDVIKNAELNNFQNISVIQKAVSTDKGEGELIVTKHPGGAKLSTVNTPLNSPVKGTIIVDIINIDGLVECQQIPPPALVKIDVEGAELKVLQGMVNTIKRFKPIIIYELDHKYEEGFMRMDKEIDAFIHTLGYEIKPLEDSYSDIKWNVKHVVAIP
jgi:FkbM family methyltransferase